MCGGREDYADVVPCRNCGSRKYRSVVVDLGMQPLANAYAECDQTSLSAEFYPLATGRCQDCGLVQLYRRPPIERMFDSDYPFRQGTSKTWVAHLKAFVVGLPDPLPDRALDVGANDGTLVKMLEYQGVDAWGIDPVRVDGVGVILGSMGVEWADTFLANNGEEFDLITAFNVLAHVSDLDDFLGGIALLLHDGGRVVFEVPDWSKSTWDQVYHEHQSYFDGFTLFDALTRRGFQVWQLEEIPTHGGSLRATCRYAG